MSTDYETIRKDAQAWIRRAGAIARERFGSVKSWRKEDRSPVTEADHAVQDALLEAIAREFPEDAVITEETQSAPDSHPSVAEDRRCWVVDPIDGTRNYARSFPSFSVSVALMERGSPVVGFVHEPMTGRMYSASAAGGIRLDDQPITPQPRPESSSLFITIPTSRHERLPQVVHDWIDRMVVRNVGSTALHLVMLATGAVDAVFCLRNKLWDVAAGALLAGKDGAEIRSLDGQPYFPMDLARYAEKPTSMPFIAARPDVLEQLLKEYQQAESAT